MSNNGSDAQGVQGDDSDPRRRNTRSMQAILTFCTELTAAEDTTVASPQTPMDPERRQFLDDVLSSIQHDVAKRLSACLGKLVQDCVFNADDDITEAEDAMEDMEAFVDDLNHASDLYKIGGYPILVSCLESPHSSLRSKSSSLIGDTCQNLPDCQIKMIECGSLPKLLLILDTDQNESCRIKALYAISCLVRGCQEGEKIFVEKNGFSHLMRSIQSGIGKLEIKSIFLMNYFVQQKEEYRDTLLSLGFVQQLMTLLMSEKDDTTREQCTCAVLCLVSNCEEAKQECTKFASDIISHLTKRNLEIKDKEEFQEEEDYISQLINLLQESTMDDAGLR